jgi:hypothetical protein
MLLQEFINRAHFTPTEKEYKKIEENYINSSLNKDEFCKKFLEDGGLQAIAAERQKALEAAMKEVKVLQEKLDLEKRTSEILQIKLEKEQEWKPYIESNMKSKDYNELYLCKGTERMSEKKAVSFVSNEFGFKQDDIRIITEMPVYEINRHHILKKVSSITCVPVYFSTDWNYVLFEVQRYRYEVVNGELYKL